MKVLDLGCGDGTTALPAARLGADVLGVDIARNLVEAGNRRAQAEGLANCRFQEGDATEPRGPRRRLLRPRRQHLRRDVRAQAVRRGQGDGARDPAGRPDRHGELDPQRSDARRADPEDQLRLLAAAAGGLRQPDDLGSRERGDRAIHGRGRRPRRTSRSCETRIASTPRLRLPSSSRSSASTTGPTMNAFEAAAENGRTADLAGGTRRALQRTERQSERRLDLDPGNVLACDCRRLK